MVAPSATLVGVCTTAVVGVGTVASISDADANFSDVVVVDWDPFDPDDWERAGVALSVADVMPVSPPPPPQAARVKVKRTDGYSFKVISAQS